MSKLPIKFLLFPLTTIKVYVKFHYEDVIYITAYAMATWLAVDIIM